MTLNNSWNEICLYLAKVFDNKCQRSLFSGVSYRGGGRDTHGERKRRGKGQEFFRCRKEKKKKYERKTFFSNLRKEKWERGKVSSTLGTEKEDERIGE